MFTSDVRDKLYKELEYKLDNKQFFNAEDYYKTNLNKEESVTQKSFSLNNISFETPLKENNSYDYADSVKGISFSNKIENNKKIKSVDELSIEDRKIYKIADLLSANLEETIVIPYNVMPTSLALVKKFEWKDVLFADI